MGAALGMESADLNLAEVERALRRNPTPFGFFTAVRLLERMRPQRTPVGGFGDPDDEVARFSAHNSLTFPASEIQELELEDDAPSRMSVNFMGLTGPLGVLPHVYTQLAIERSRNRDDALAEFLDIFHHRMLSLFYRAWEKHRFTVRYEKEGTDPVEDHLLDLVGLGLEGERSRSPVAAEALAFYAGLLAPVQRSAVALEQVLSDYFAAPVSVEQFVGGWYPIGERDQCELDEPVPASRLGGGAVVGDEIFDPQGRVRIRIGPLKRALYERFLPTGDAHAALRNLVRLFAHDQFEFELQLVMEQSDVPGVMLGDPEERALGWTTWIRATDRAAHADETVLTL